MPEPLNISVSKLERFEDFLHERWSMDQQKFMDYITGKEVPTYAKDYGTAIHKYLEYPHEAYEQQPGGIIVEGEFISNVVLAELNRCLMTIPEPSVSEVWVNKEVEVRGFAINLRGKIDKLSPMIARDFKTTRSKPSYDAYMDKTQHQWYMWMAEVPNFVYDVFFIQDKDASNVRVTHEPYVFQWEPSIEQSLLSTLKMFVDFINTHGMIEGWNEMVKSSKQLTI